MIKVDAMGDTCPIPVVKTKNAIKELKGSGEVQTLVDNEIAVQNLTKMANQKGYGVKSQKLGEGKYEVTMTISDGNADAITTTGDSAEEEQIVCYPDARKKNTVVVLASATMGAGDEELGEILMKGFIYALSQQEDLPKTILFYNGGAYLTCEGSASLDDLKELELRGVRILTCGTCLNFYGLSEKLKVGEVTNMYEIAETMSKASLIVSP